MIDHRISLLEKTKLFVLDMDGTFYLGEHMIDGSLEFLRTLEHTGRRYMFFTNNSSKSAETYVKKLRSMNCSVDASQIMTSGDVMIEYLKQYYPGHSVYLLGTDSLKTSFLQSGIPLTEEQPDIVVVGFDTTLTYHKLERACSFIRNGALFLATHMDINCPIEDGFIPDCGALCAAITRSTGKAPKYMGKPFPETIELILKKTGAPRDQISFVGDRLYTDVAAGVNNGVTGFLVLTGETKTADLDHAKIRPDGVFLSLKEMGDLLRTSTEKMILC